jgi:D-alanyl-D-alanine carboxypeptidase
MITFGEPGTKPRYTDISSWSLGGWANTAGAMISTAEELDRFFSALLGGKLLPPAQLAQMRTTVPQPKDPEVGYGLGLVRLTTPCGVAWGHGGDTLGHHSTALFSPDGQRGAVADSTTQLDQRVKPNATALKAVETIGTADATAVCTMYGKTLPT